MGSTSTTATANWTSVQDAPGFPTDISGTDAKIYINNATPPFGGEAWSDIDLMAAIPAGATITDMTFSLTVEVDGSRSSPSLAIAPLVQFIDKAEYLAHSFIAGYGIFGAGSVGDLPDDNDPHTITYDNNTYSAFGGIFDVDAFAAALSNPSTPVILRALAPQNATTGTGLTYSAPLTITFLYDTGATFAPPLQQYPRHDGLGASSVRLHWPDPNSPQRGIQRGPSAMQ